MSMLMDGSVRMDDLLDLQGDPDLATVDPQLSMGFFNNLSGKAAPEPMTIDPSLWATPQDTVQRFDMVQPQGYLPEDNMEGSIDSPTHNTRARAGKTERTSSKSSVPSLSSGSTGSPASPGKPTQTRSKPTKKQDSKPARKKQKTSKKADVSDGEDDSKRNKYLERNRVAASKCRQKKKVWVNDLEAQKSEMEQKHSNLQREYTGLVDEVTQLKNQLMAHAGCGDARIDGWIETEAKRFVQRTTDRDQQSRRLSAGSSSGRRQSFTESLVQQPSPTMSNGAFPLSPIIKEEINYDHMPDDMFQ